MACQTSLIQIQTIWVWRVTSKETYPLNLTRVQTPDRQNIHCLFSQLHFSFNLLMSLSCAYFLCLFFFSSWWRITTHLGWSVLQLSDGLDFFKSADSLSQTLVHLLFAAYLVMAVILLINMLIALLSNTYQRVQVSSCHYLFPAVYVLSKEDKFWRKQLGNFCQTHEEIKFVIL